MERLTEAENESKIQKYFKSRLPILKWFPAYKASEIFSDGVAGLSVGLTAIPQSMAYSLIAGLTPEYGLYSSFIPCLLYIFFGSCRQMTIGPTAVVELLTFETCGQDFAPCAILIGFYVGLIQLLLGIFQLGFVVSLISEAVTIGFVGGAATTIASSQLKSFLGLKGSKGRGFIGYWKVIINNIHTLSLGDTLMGILCVVFLVVLKYLKSWTKPSERTSLGKSINKALWFLSISRNALVVVISGLVAYLWTNPPFELTGNVKSGFPPVSPPTFLLPSNNGTTFTFWSSLDQLGSGPLSVAMISILQNVAIAKAFASGQSIDANQEMIALGFCHLVGSFFSSIPVSGSFSRSAVNEASGVRSPFSGLFTCGVVMLALSLLTPSFYFIPKSSLAAVILCAVVPMIEYQSLIPMWKVSKLDLFACIVTFITSLIFGMEYGILIGIATSIAIYLIRPLRPKIQWQILPLQPGISHLESCLDLPSPEISQQQQHPVPSSSVDNSPEENNEEQLLASAENYLLLLIPELGFSFPSVDYIRTFINKKIFILDEKCSWIAIDCKNMINLDYTAATALVSLSKALKNNGKTLIFLNCKADWPNILEIIGLGNSEGNQHIFFESLASVYEYILNSETVCNS